MRLTSPSYRRRVTLVLAGASLIALSACVAIPDTDTAPIAQGLQAAQSLPGQGGQWPGSQWWRDYHDPQLDALIIEAFSASPSIQDAEARLAKARSLDEQLRGALLPEVRFNSSVSSVKQSYNNGFPAAFVPHGYLTAARATFDVTYDLDFWGQSRQASKYAAGMTEAARIDSIAARQTLAQSITGAYIQLDTLYRERDHVAVIKRGSVRTLHLISARVERNLDPQDRLLAAQDEDAQLDARLLQIDAGIDIQKNLIAALAGAGPDRGRTITRPTLSDAGGWALPDNAPVDLLGRRPDIVAARLRVEAAGHGVKAARGEFYPNINLSAYWGAQSLGLQHLLESGSDIGGIGPAISLPLFNASQIRSTYLSYSADYNQAVAAYNATLTRALQQTADAAVALKTIDGQITAAERRLEAAETAYELAHSRLERGLSTEIEVLRAHAQLISVEMERDDLKAQALSARLSLTMALGGGFDPGTVATP